ncbi:MAG: hypothetical protein HS127_20385 [Planctomycetia bacterium]|nr:hypothetical protein [Planctomycetia bacterium]
MGNGRFDVCSAPAAYRAKVIENGLRKTRELCDDHYQKLLHRAGGRSGCGFRSPLESMFGGSLLILFGGRDPFDSVIGHEPSDISHRAHQNLGDRESVDLDNYLSDDAKDILQKAARKSA